MSISQEFPRLELTFAEEDADHFLVDASFRSDGIKAANRKLVQFPPKGKAFRAMCILMLLAKYQGEAFADEDGHVTIVGPLDKPTWIKTLGTFFDSEHHGKFLTKYFNDRRFLSASRGSAHNTKNKKPASSAPPFAKYLSRHLLLRNIHIKKVTSGSEPGRTAVIEGEELALFAEKLENHEVGKPEGWEPFVAHLIAKTKEDRPSESKDRVDKSSSEYAQGAPFILSAPWQKLFQRAHRDVETRVTDGSWYVVCITPSRLMDWKEIFCGAVRRHNAHIKFAYHSPSAAENCPAMRAQWRMHTAYVKTEEDRAEYVRDRLEELKGELASWAKEAWKDSPLTEPSRGAFEFYESYITHPFLAIMHVPPQTSDNCSEMAPKGTWCVVRLYSLYPAALEDHCGLYLNGPSPMLDIYYHSILRFFEHGPKDGYLKLVDLPHGI